MNATNRIPHVRRITHLALALVLMASLGVRAQGVFQANLGVRSDNGTGELILGRFYLRAEDNRADFVAVLSSVQTFTSNLSPSLSIPGQSVEFQLGESVATEFSGSHTRWGRNPFLPPEPLVPAGYDEDGNPYFVDVPVTRFGDVYTGSFALPQGFVDGLLAGNGVVQFNSSLIGAITLDSVPEPATVSLMVLGLVILLGHRFRRISRSN